MMDSTILKEAFVTACNPKSPAGIKGSYSNEMVIMVHAYEFIVAIN